MINDRSWTEIVV